MPVPRSGDVVPRQRESEIGTEIETKHKAETSPTREIITPGAALGCLERVRASLGTDARLFVAVDAPKLQATIFLTPQP